MHRHTMIAAFAFVLVACSGAVEPAEPAPCSPVAAADASADAPPVVADAGADAAPNPCVEDDHTIAMCVRLGAPTGWTASGACDGIPIKRANLREIVRPDGLACCEDLRGDDRSGALCCPETCK